MSLPWDELPPQMGLQPAGQPPAAPQPPQPVSSPKPSFKQRIKNSYKAIVATIGALLTLATQIQAITPFLPTNARDAIGAVVAALTGISTFLVHNEPLVENL